MVTEGSEIIVTATGMPLDPAAQPDEDRIRRIQGQWWIGYSRAKHILGRLNELLNYPKHHRMPNLLIAGETTNGKTMLVHKFHKMNLAQWNPDLDGINIPVLIVQAPAIPDVNGFFIGILEKLFSPYKAKDPVQVKQFQVIHLLRQLNVRMLVIDEIHDILAGPLLKQRQFLNTLKHLGNDLQIPIVGVGTYDAVNAVRTDPQMANRFEPEFLPKWEMGDEYLRLLASFESLLPLKSASNLTETSLALKILAMSEGTVGGIDAVLKRAAVKAIQTGEERVTLRGLESIGWVQPRERGFRRPAGG